MTFARWRGSLVLALATALLAAGCGPTDYKDGQAKGKRTQPQEKAVAAEGHDHSGWWCDEHGIPEEICGQCNAKYAAECKKKGDWCKEHDRPQSQCFLCHPELKEKFAAQYRAKYGKEPPPTEDDEGKKDEARSEKRS
jgi:cobalt-zinc-cadmium efflux system membrane fusion protein